MKFYFMHDLCDYSDFYMASLILIYSCLQDSDISE